MRDQPRRRRSVNPALLRFLRPFFRLSVARDAYVLRLGGGQYGPVLVDKTAPGVVAPVVLPEPKPAPTGRFQRTDVVDAPVEPPITRTRQG